MGIKKGDKMYSWQVITASKAREISTAIQCTPIDGFPLTFSVLSHEEQCFLDALMSEITDQALNGVDHMRFPVALEKSVDLNHILSTLEIAGYQVERVDNDYPDINLVTISWK